MIPHMSTTSYIVPSLPSKSLGPSLYLAIAPLSIPPLTKTTLSGFPRDEFPSTGGWIDNIAEKIDHLVSLLTQADDIPRSRQGWIHLSALKRYDGPAVPGNQDPHANTILFTLSRGGSSTPLDDAALFNLVAFDNRRRKYRLTLGEYRGPTRNQLVIALSSDLPRPCWTALLPQHIVGLCRLPPPRLPCPTFPLSEYTSAVNQP